MAIPGNFLSQTTESIDPNFSGWRPRMNCTLTLGSGGRNGGSGCLLLKSSAAGEMQAETVAAYTVTPGETYMVLADTGATAQPERIGIEWLDATYTPVGTITWSMTTSSAMLSWHRISVAGAAPSGAVRARVVLSSLTPSTSNVNHFFENIYLGRPITMTGNLFSFNTESAELSAAGWTAETNSTVARQVPPVQWQVDNYAGGGHVIAMTATAAGNASMRSTDRATVTPGVEYQAFAYLNPPTMAASTWVELRYYDATVNQISATRSYLAAPGTGWYRQWASAVAPSNAVTCAIAAGIDGASAGQVLRVETVAVTTVPVLQAGTILPYADGSFEQGLAGWTKTSGVATIARSTPWGIAAVDGAYAMTVTSSTATASVVRSGRFPALASTWRAQVWASPTAGSWTSVNIKVRWYDAADADLGTTGGTTYAFPGTSWYALSTDATAPVGATQAAIELTLTAAAINSTVQIDLAALWEALPLTSVEAVDSTASTRLTLRELNLGFLITVYRVLSDGSRTLVRGLAGLLNQTEITSDFLLIEDYEAPLGVPVSYRVELLEPGDTVAATRTSEQVTITPGDLNLCWLKDPGRPQRNLQLMVKSPPEWKRPIQQAQYRVRGRRNTVTHSDSRGGLEGDLVVWTRSDDEYDALNWILDSGETLLWQVVPGVHETDMYVSVGEVPLPRAVPRADEVWREWTLPLTQTDMPVGVGIGGTAGRTWQDVLTQFATWEEVRNAYASWEDVLFDRRIGG